MFGPGFTAICMYNFTYGTHVGTQFFVEEQKEKKREKEKKECIFARNPSPPAVRRAVAYRLDTYSML